MTVSGILSGLTNPFGSGFALSRSAARVDSISPTRRPQEDASEQFEGAETPADVESLFDTRDIVDLSKSASNQQLSEEEQEQVQELKQRDTEVRAHEQAHLAAAGSYAKGGASFEYQTGPDGRRYAVGGEVQIDTSPVEGDPQATVQKMQQVRAAALAPGSPSGQDRAVAAQAAAAIQEAQAEQARPEPESEQSDPVGQSGSIKTTGNHEFGARASAASEHGIQTALEQFSKPKGRESAPGQTKKAEPIIAFDFATQRPPTDVASSGELLDLVA